MCFSPFIMLLTRHPLTILFCARRRLRHFSLTQPIRWLSNRFSDAQAVTLPKKATALPQLSFLDEHAVQSEAEENETSIPLRLDR